MDGYFAAIRASKGKPQLMPKVIRRLQSQKECRVIFISALLITSVIFSGCNLQPVPTMLTSVPTDTSTPTTTPTPIEVKEPLQIYDVSVVTHSSTGLIQVGANPDRWERAEIGQVEISLKTNSPTRLDYLVQCTLTPMPLGYNQCFQTLPEGPTKVYVPGVYKTTHSFSGENLLTFATYQYEIFCTDQNGRQVSYSGTFIVR